MKTKVFIPSPLLYYEMIFEGLKFNDILILRNQ
mgnify:CR=1 FL=1